MAGQLEAMLCRLDEVGGLHGDLLRAMDGSRAARSGRLVALAGKGVDDGWAARLEVEVGLSGTKRLEEAV